MKKHEQRSIIPNRSGNLDSPTAFINKNAALWKAFTSESDEANIFISIRYLKYGHQCFSSWNQAEMKAFWEFSERIHQLTWTMLRQTGGKGENKAGLGYTIIPLKDYPKNLRTGIEPGSNLFELRISQKARVHCFRDRSICYLYLLDKDHEIFPV